MVDYVAPALASDGDAKTSAAVEGDEYGLTVVADLLDDPDVATALSAAHYHIMHNHELRPSRADEVRVRRHAHPSAHPAAAIAAAAVTRSDAGPASGGWHLGASTAADPHAGDAGPAAAAAAGASVYDADTDDDDAAAAPPQPILHPSPAARGAVSAHPSTRTDGKGAGTSVPTVVRAMAKAKQMTTLKFAEYVLTLDATGRQELLDEHYNGADTPHGERHDRDDA